MRPFKFMRDDDFRDELHSENWRMACRLAIHATVCLLAVWALAPRGAEGQRYLGSDDGDQTSDAMPLRHRTFRVADRWAEIRGMRVDVRHRIGSLLGEPWEVSSVRYDFDERAQITIHQYSTKSEMQVKKGSALAVIRVTDGGSLRVRDMRIGDGWDPESSSMSFEVLVPADQFRDKVRLTDVYYNFTALDGGSTVRRRYQGILFGAGEWGWDIPGSPDWSRLFESNVARASALPRSSASRGGYIKTGRDIHRRLAATTFFHSEGYWARAFTGNVNIAEENRKQALFDSYNVSMDISALLYEAAKLNSDFMRVLYGRPRVALVASIAGSINAGENGGADRGRRRALLDRALAQAGEIPADVRTNVDAAQDRLNGIQVGQRDREVFAATEALMEAPVRSLQSAVERAQQVASAVADDPGQFGSVGRRLATALGSGTAPNGANRVAEEAPGGDPSVEIQRAVGDRDLSFLGPGQPVTTLSVSPGLMQISFTNRWGNLINWTFKLGMVKTGTSALGSRGFLHLECPTLCVSSVQANGSNLDVNRSDFEFQTEQGGRDLMRLFQAWLKSNGAG
jgi:hypothetical protein